MGPQKESTRRSFLGFAAAGIAGATVGFASKLEAQTSTTSLSAKQAVYDVRTYGAKGDGTTVDTPAINRAIDSVSAAGGGTLYFPAGNYLCYTIHLKSNVALYLDHGVTIVAGETGAQGQYDPAEPNQWDHYQDYGHSHWHNSLILGEEIHDFSIVGPGLIWGKGLSRGSRQGPRAEDPGVGNKAISLKNCHNVNLRDFSILHGGHFGILATGVDNLTIDNLKIDTNRDGVDIDCCSNVRVSNCSVNSPWDDGICLKSSFGLGYARATENVTITNCFVSGSYMEGTLLDGTRKPFPPGERVPRNGRIKFGTESNGGFRNIAIANCVFESCRGLALETVDGGIMEDITVTGVTMRDIRNAPLFLRLGSRMRGPAGTPVGALKRVLISNVTCHAPLNDMPSIISGVPGHAVEDIQISNCYFLQKGGGTAEMAALQPSEQPSDYPEPARLGPLPAQHFYIRHARNLEISNVELRGVTVDARPSFWLGDVNTADLMGVKLTGGIGPAVSLNNVSDFRALANRGLKDVSIEGPISHMQL